MSPSNPSKLTSSPVEPPAAAACPAVASCWAAWETLYQAKIAAGSNMVNASIEADLAYRNAMPPLSGQSNIRDFIACTAHGLLVGIIQYEDASKLLSAARVALVALRNQPAPPKTKAKAA